MELFGISYKKSFVPRIAAKDLVAAVFLMAASAKKIKSNVVFFPEAGGLPLKYIFKQINLKPNNDQIKIFSSKITALSKSSLSKQIGGILTANERRQCLTENQIAAFKKNANKLPKRVGNELKKSIDSNNLKRYNLCEIVSKIGEIGLEIPSEDKTKWLKLGIVSRASELKVFSPENCSFERFQKFKKKIIIFTIDSFSGIIHEIRPLLNIVLANTDFAKAIAGNKIYVIDEAVSRGRTLNALEIIFKAFNNDIEWKIGVLYCPANVAGVGNIDFILSHSHIPPFSNRFDLIGNIIVESETAFVRYNIEELFLKRKNKGFIPNRTKVTRYLKSLRRYLKNNFSDFLADQIFTEDDLIRLLHFVFTGSDTAAVRRCINLNPSKVPGLIEEADFYINMPNPFDPMPVRRVYKNCSLRFLDYFENLTPGSSAAKDLKNFKKYFYEIKKDFEFLELQCWVKRRRNNIKNIDFFINKIKQSHEPI